MDNASLPRSKKTFHRNLFGPLEVSSSYSCKAVVADTTENTAKLRGCQVEARHRLVFGHDKCGLASQKSLQDLAQAALHGEI